MRSIKEKLIQIGCEKLEAEALFERYKKADRLNELEEYVEAKLILNREKYKGNLDFNIN